MIPSSRAATADHRYPPMLVGDVYAERVDGSSDPSMLSAGRAVTGSTMAAIDRQVSTAYRRSSRAAPGSAAAGVGGPPIRPPRPWRTDVVCAPATSLESGRRDAPQEV